MNVETIAVDQIDVTERRRSDFGDLEGLAAGIKRVGLLAPILVDRNGSGRFRLVFGERRLRAVKSLGLTSIAAQLREHLTDEQFRAIELEENDNRKALTEGERSRTFESAKKLVEKAEQVAGILLQSETKLDHKRGRGRPAKKGSTRAVAEALGTSAASLVRAGQQVETATKFAFMQGKDWRQSQVLAVREQFENIPEAEHEKVVQVLSCARLIDPALAVELVGKIARKSVKDRKELYDLSQSEDSRDRSRALSLANETPPLPDPRLIPLDEMNVGIRRMIRDYPVDSFTPALQTVSPQLKAICAGLKTTTATPERKGIIQ